MWENPMPKLCVPNFPFGPILMYITVINAIWTADCGPGENAGGHAADFDLGYAGAGNVGRFVGTDVPISALAAAVHADYTDALGGGWVGRDVLARTGLW